MLRPSVFSNRLGRTASKPAARLWQSPRQRRLRSEPLKDRRMLAVLTVNNIVWAGQYDEGVPVLPAGGTDAAEEPDAVDAALANDYDEGASVTDWQLSRAFDTLLKRRDKKGK